MKGFQSKKQNTKFYKSNIFFALVLIVLLIVSRATYSVYKKEKISREILEEKHREFSELTDRQEVLRQEIERLATERGVEEEIRNKFGFVKGNEGLIILVDDKSTSTEMETEERDNIFKRFLNLIF